MCRVLKRNFNCSDCVRVGKWSMKRYAIRAMRCESFRHLQNFFFRQHKSAGEKRAGFWRRVIRKRFSMSVKQKRQYVALLFLENLSTFDSVNNNIVRQKNTTQLKDSLDSWNEFVWKRYMLAWNIVQKCTK